VKIVKTDFPYYMENKMHKKLNFFKKQSDMDMTAHLKRCCGFFLVITWFSFCLVIQVAEAVTYDYDLTGRLVRVDFDNGKYIAYTYDKAGNLLTRACGGIPGDVSTNKTVDLEDAILVLKVTSRIASASASVSGDVNQDNIIGQAEAIYILNKISTPD